MTIDYFFKPVHDPQVHSVTDNIGEVEDQPIYVEPKEIGKLKNSQLTLNLKKLLQELNSRFHKSELLRLGVALDPKKPFNVDDICKLATTYYPADFTEHEKKDLLELELQHFELDVRNHPHLKNCSTLQELCIGLH
ncbi:hypothetical protein LXL04_000240 [Taraxacum kok-saghyz]